MEVTHVSDAVEPYLEDSTERVFEANDLHGDFHLTCGLGVERLNIDPAGVTASSFSRFQSGDRDDRGQHISLINQHDIEGVDDVNVVWDRQEALVQETHVAWVMTDGDAVEYPHPLASSVDADVTRIRLPTDVYVYERIPFVGSIDSIAALESELEDALSVLASGDISITLD